jgi:hypothetical protein
MRRQEPRTPKALDTTKTKTAAGARQRRLYL